MAHGAEPGRVDVPKALVGALAAVIAKHATLYADVVVATLPLVAHRHLEELMSAGTARIVEYDDVDQPDRWLRRAATADSADDLLD